MKVDEIGDTDVVADDTDATSFDMHFDKLLDIARGEFRENTHYELCCDTGRQTLWTAALFAAEKVTSCERACIILVMGANHHQVDGEKPLHMSPLGGESHLEVLQLMLASMILQVLEQDAYLIADGAGANGRC